MNLLSLSQLIGLSAMEGRVMKLSRGVVALGAVCLLATGGILNRNASQEQQQATFVTATVGGQATATVEAQATATAQAQQATNAANGNGDGSGSSKLVITNNQLTPGTGQRLFVFVNNLKQTIWVGGGTSPGINPDDGLPYPPITTTGWVLPAGNSVSTLVPNHWDGRFWGRTGCDASGANCATGNCPGGLQCTAFAQPPATLAEFNLEGERKPQGDTYDISLVDGSNVPLYINTIGGTTPDPMSANGCTSAGCTSDVQCPSLLQIPGGCKSACLAFGTDQYCCQGTYSDAQKCNPALWPVNYAQPFKTAESFAYSYAYDDATSTLTCKGSCGYRITFGVSS